MTTFNLADLFETVADLVPDQTAVVVDHERRTYATLEERANRLAHALAARGIGAGDSVAAYLYNTMEHVELLLACFKLRAVPINVNFRFVGDELRYLFDDADVRAVVYDAAFRANVDDLAPGGAGYVLLEVGGHDADRAYDAALAVASPARHFGTRSGDDLYVIYTGGTTGKPKGVVWRQEDAFFACVGGGDPLRRMGPISAPEEIVGRIVTDLSIFPVAPLMHAAAQWNVLSTLLAGGKLVLTASRSLDPARVLELATIERVATLVVIGDAVARPLEAELTGRPERYDLSALKVLGSGGALLSSSMRARWEALLPGAMVVDGFGSSESGVHASSIGPDGAMQASMRFVVSADTTVLDDDLQPVRAGSGQIGRVARSGHIPLGYRNDPARTAVTFVEAVGRRWVMPGDMATVEPDGSITLLGRGAAAINTGGEKVFPDEVELVIKDLAAVRDVVVVGVPDERWGERVVAVVEPVDGETVALAAVVDACRGRLASYKHPRQVVVVRQVVRSPVGKADYGWARRAASAERT